MSTEEWTLLVKRVDMLITELKQTRSQANHWRTKAAELERLYLGNDRQARLESQARDRELERLKKERKKMQSTISKILEELNMVEKHIMEKSKS